MQKAPIASKRWGFRWEKGMASFGGMLRDTGNRICSWGAFLQGHWYNETQISRHRRLMGLEGHRPFVGQGSWIAPNASVIGSVNIGTDSSIWYGTVVRGDVKEITIGNNTHILDRCVVHARSAIINAFIPLEDIATNIGNNVTVEAGTILHACTIHDGAKIELGCKILDGAVIGERAVITPGSLVPPGHKVPADEVWGGSPAKFIRLVTTQETALYENHLKQTRELVVMHSVEDAKSFDALAQEVDFEMNWEEGSVLNHGEEPPPVRQIKRSGRM